MIRTIVGILVALTLQFVAMACSHSSSEATHTTCPEAAMTLSDNDSDDNHGAAVDYLRHSDITAAEPAQNGAETLKAMGRQRVQTATWQWQRVVRAVAKSLMMSDSHDHCVMTAASTETFGIDAQSTGYVYVIRHILI